MTDISVLCLLAFFSGAATAAAPYLVREVLGVARKRRQEKLKRALDDSRARFYEEMARNVASKED